VDGLSTAQFASISLFFFTAAGALRAKWMAGTRQPNPIPIQINPNQPKSTQINRANQTNHNNNAVVAYINLCSIVLINLAGIPLMILSSDCVSWLDSLLTLPQT
jgi:hypothetical protein